MLYNTQKRQELRITNTLRRAIYRESCKLEKEGWQKKGEIKKINISSSFNKKYIIYSQDFVKWSLKNTRQ